MNAIRIQFHRPQTCSRDYMIRHPDFSGTSGSGFMSFSISATMASKILPTFSLCRADDSMKAVLPHDFAIAAPSSLVTCLEKTIRES